MGKFTLKKNNLKNMFVKKAKKTRKFAAVKRMINPKDMRIKKNQKKAEEKRKKALEAAARDGVDLALVAAVVPLCEQTSWLATQKRESSPTHTSRMCRSYWCSRRGCWGRSSRRGPASAGSRAPRTRGRSLSPSGRGS